MDAANKQAHLIKLIKSNQKIEAIKFLRESDNLDLITAKRQIEALEDQLRANGEMPEKSKAGCGALIFLSMLPLAVTLLAWLLK